MPWGCPGAFSHEEPNAHCGPASCNFNREMINYVPPRIRQSWQFPRPLNLVKLGHGIPNHSAILSVTPWHPESSRARPPTSARPDHLEALVTIVARPSGSHAILWSCESFVSSFVASFAWNWHPWNSSFRWTRCCHHLTWDEKGREMAKIPQMSWISDCKLSKSSVWFFC